MRPPPRCRNRPRWKSGRTWVMRSSRMSVSEQDLQVSTTVKLTKGSHIAPLFDFNLPFSVYASSHSAAGKLNNTLTCSGPPEHQNTTPDYLQIKSQSGGWMVPSRIVDQKSGTRGLATGAFPNVIAAHSMHIHTST